jgi:O-antigen ligase
MQRVTSWPASSVRSHRLHGWYSDPFRADTSLVIALLALVCAALCGLLLASNVFFGVAFLIAVCYAPLAAINLPVALAIWVMALFVARLPAVSVAANAAGLMVAFAWFAALHQRRVVLAELLRRHVRLFLALVLLIVWFALSLAWSEDTSLGLPRLWRWPVIALLILVVSTTVTRPEHVRWLLIAFVIGAVLSVTIGFLNSGLNVVDDGIERATATDGRLQGGAGDPNFLAAGLIPATVAAGALMGTVRGHGWRLLLAAAIAIMAVGLVATQSRGALVAAGVAVVAGLVAFKRQRAYFVAIVTIVVSCGVLWFMAYPTAWTRVTSFDDGGAGREDLWRVADRMAQDHPVIGVGLYNFRARSADYVREPGSLESVRLIAERPHVAHNTYLELLAETGLVGFILYMSVIGACLAALRRAARHFDVLRERSLALMARAVLVAAIAMLAAGVFISYASDTRLWVLLALGPAMLGVSTRLQRSRGDGTFPPTGIYAFERPTSRA